MFTYRKGTKGFTLVEIMIVVAIIALIAAIAIPNLLRARHNANEGAAIGNMHALVSAMESFRANQTPPAYPAALDDLGNATPPYVDAVLASGTRQGYDFTYAQGAAAANGAVSTYTLTAIPVTANVDGTRGFWADESGVIRVDAAGDPDVGDPPLE